MSILMLNRDVMGVINEFIKYDNNLLICNKELKELKLGYCIFNATYSLQYYNDIMFRILVQKQIATSKLSLDLSKVIMIFSFNDINTYIGFN